MLGIFHSPHIPPKNYQETRLDSDPETPELVHPGQMLKPSRRGTNFLRRQRVMASDQRVLTLIPTISHPAGTRSSTQITVWWSQRSAASMHNQQRCHPHLLSDVLSPTLCFHTLNAVCCELF